MAICIVQPPGDSILALRRDSFGIETVQWPPRGGRVGCADRFATANRQTLALGRDSSGPVGFRGRLMTQLGPSPCAAGRSSRPSVAVLSPRERGVPPFQAWTGCRRRSAGMGPRSARDHDGPRLARCRAVHGAKRGQRGAEPSHNRAGGGLDRSCRRGD